MFFVWDECENVSHVLWECSAYSSSIRDRVVLEDEYI